MPLNAADLQKYPPKPKSVRKATLADRADEHIDVLDILDEMGLRVPRGEYNSWKTYCPFKEEHGDGGLDKNFRVYPPTHVYCFAMHGRMSSTALYARWKSLPKERAAAILLDRAGLLKRGNYRERWQELVLERGEPDTEHSAPEQKAWMVAALRGRVRADAAYSVSEYAAEVRDAWQRALAALDYLLSEHPAGLTLETGRAWLDAASASILSASTLARQDRA